jgi:hypothetical protein
MQQQQTALAVATTAMLHAIDPVAFIREALLVELDPWQAELATAMAAGNAKRAIATCSRQSGKSSTAGMIATHWVVHRPGDLVMMVAPTLRQSNLLAAKAFSCLRQIPHVKLVQEAVQHVRLSNGSQIVSVPGGESAGVRGFTPNLLIVDESAFIADEGGLWEAVMPSLAVSGGSLLLCSTPNGRQGLHYEIATNSEADEWLRFLIPWQKCPRITPEFIEEQRRLHGPRYVQTEFECQFQEASGQYFDQAAIDAVLDRSIQRLHLTF